MLAQERMAMGMATFEPCTWSLRPRHLGINATTLDFDSCVLLQARVPGPHEDTKVGHVLIADAVKLTFHMLGYPNTTAALIDTMLTCLNSPACPWLHRPMRDVLQYERGARLKAVASSFGGPRQGHARLGDHDMDCYRTRIPKHGYNTVCQVSDEVLSISFFGVDLVICSGATLASWLPTVETHDHSAKDVFRARYNGLLFGQARVDTPGIDKHRFSGPRQQLAMDLKSHLETIILVP